MLSSCSRSGIDLTPISHHSCPSQAQRVSTQSRLVGLVAESLEGLDVIQAFDKKDFFIDEAIVR